MKFKSLAIIFLASVLLFGCSKKLNPNTAYTLLQKREVIKASQIGYITPTDIVLPGKQEMYKLSITDSVAGFGTNSEMLSNFRIFYLDTKPNTNYNVTVKSYCDCFGFTKHVFEPIIHIFNGSQSLKPELNDAHYNEGKDGLIVKETWTFTSKNYNTKLLVYSNNKELNRTTHKLDIFAIKIPIKNTIGGKFSILLEEVK
jgi:hypothetical protein